MSVVQYDDVLYESLEIRVLGPLRVRRANGTVVQPAEWLTSQTADLLRLLAVRVNEPVAVDVLTEALWPKVDEARGRASLRNAASRLRKVLGEDCVQRSLGGLVLTGAWVDAHAFRTLAHQARREMMAGASAQVVTTTREAEAVYLGEFRAQNETADWSVRERDALAATYRTMVADAAEAAAALGWWHDAIAFAERTLHAEPVSERAFRVLMRAQRGMGETALALKTYDRCRRVLAEDVGADPSPATRKLYLELLADEPVAPPVPPFSGRTHESEWIGELLETVAATGAPAMVCLTGEPRSGKTRLVEHAVSAGGVPLTTVTCTPTDDPWPAVRAAAERATGAGPAGDARPRAGGGAVAVLVDDAHVLPREAVDALAERLATLTGPVCVFVAGRPALADGRATTLVRRWGGPASRLTLPPLESEEVAELCAALLRGEVSEQLVQDVLAQTGGAAGAVVALVREWAAAGRIAATSSGLVVLQPQVPGETDATVRQLLTEAVDHLPPNALDLLQLVAVVGRPVTVELLLPLTSGLGLAAGANDFQWLRTTLDHLTDLALLKSTQAGLVPRDALFNDLVQTWLRPSARRQLHRRVAEQAYITAAERVEHWTRAGEPQLARAAAMDAAADAVEDHQHERARLHLRRLCRTSEESNATPADRAELYERWGDAAALLGRTHEARAAYAAGASTARAHGLPDRARLELKSRQVVEGTIAPAPTREPDAPPAGGTATPPVDRRPPDVGAPSATPAVAPAWPYAGAPTDVDHLTVRSQQAIREADAQGDPDLRASARTRYIWDVGIPQRKFRAVRRVSKQALGLATDPDVRADALAGGWIAGAVVGDAAAAEVGLGRSAGGRGAAAGSGALLAVRALVAHDLGRREARSLLTAAAEQGLLADPLRYQWLAIRVATERYDFGAAMQADAAPTPANASPLVRALRACASAALAMELGRPDEARPWLTQVIEDSRRTGVTLLVPEAAARLAVLEAHTDAPSARRRFDQFEEAVEGQTAFPRESVLKLVARAAMRSADGRHADAAASVAGAADVAERAGLVHLAALAHRHRAFHLTAAGSVHEARLAAAAEARWRNVGSPKGRRRAAEPPAEDPEPAGARRGGR
ncbi:BTAD domain-containing putative transcriptional regulator [Cellulomonas aerilata]|uniref:Bacterial transcriptional activator domain-containing protein n=1 Tax=Cellulomonas aerilata TaxID=515326 RepID=A0A512D750_9CELL|nr:BTAD domain-containing putative transcriptional regulator [Cellulomonas aerilata]GEO32308.1 hypothetical protein CAE01nite_00330 [Cellulomonas aerilata]